MMVSSFQAKEKKRKHKGKKNHKFFFKCKEGKELTFLLFFAFGMKHSSCLLLSTVELSTFLKPCVSRLLEALSYSSSRDEVSGK
jgi:hypothetical protein